MNSHSLQLENLAYAGTKGVSRNADPVFRPAFLDRATGCIELARQPNGIAAPFHLISWLPHRWALTLNDDGSIETLKPSVIAGFETDGVFYTRDEVAEL